MVPAWGRARHPTPLPRGVRGQGRCTGACTAVALHPAAACPPPALWHARSGRQLHRLVRGAAWLSRLFWSRSPRSTWLWGLRRGWISAWRESGCVGVVTAGPTRSWCGAGVCMASLACLSLHPRPAAEGAATRALRPPRCPPLFHTPAGRRCARRCPAVASSTFRQVRARVHHVARAVPRLGCGCGQEGGLTPSTPPPPPPPPPCRPAGALHSAFVADTGALLTCGWGLYGQLGHGGIGSRFTPHVSGGAAAGTHPRPLTPMPVTSHPHVCTHACTPV